MNKKEYIKKINEFIEENEIRSTNGRGYNADIQFNFNCKYYNLKRKNQDAFFYFLDKDESQIMFDLFDEDLKNLKDITDFEKHKDILEYIDFKNTGFYGRSDGNYTIGLNNNYLSNLEYLDINELKNLYEWTKKADAFFVDFKEWFFNWWNTEIEFSIKDHKDLLEQDIIELKDQQKQLTEIDVTNKEEVLKQLITEKLEKIKAQILEKEKELEEVMEVMQNE